MKYLYGEFTQEQINSQIKSLHSAMFWLLLYKDTNTNNKYKNVDFNKYFTNLMYRIDGFSNLIYNPPETVTLLSILQAAYKESLKEDFNFLIYRKLILDAHSTLDKLKGCD